ncbi:MAG TPA: peptide MFS transporter [Steroidobacteraceae bacterium]|nr:peptide MFS transporter [Steroidobacteraceae bacterium]
MTDSSTRTPVVVPALTGQFLGHPRGLATLFFIEMWERFSYYGMRALLILYMTAAARRGGLGLGDESAGAIYGLYTGGAYLCTLPGGWIADRLIGRRAAVSCGGALIALGNLLLALGARPERFYLGLLVIALGTGLLKPNASCLVGELYEGDSGARRDAGFSIYYLGINAGAFLAPFVAGTLGETVGYHWGFLAAALAMTLGLVQYRATSRWLGGAGERPRPPSARRDWLLLSAAIAALAALVVAVASGAVHLRALVLAREAGGFMLALAVLFFLAVTLGGRLTALERRRVAVLAIFFVAAAVFWAGYEQAGSSLNLFARDYTDRSLFGGWFSSGKHPASWYQSFQAVFILLLAPVFAWLWIALERRRSDPSAPMKLGLGLVQLALSFLVMTAATRLILHTGRLAAPGWLVLTYLLQTTGELCLSPVGLSNVTKLAPRRFAGQMMGVWFLGTAIGNLAAGLLGGEAVASGATQMARQFLDVAMIAGGAGLALIAAARPVRAWASEDARAP